MKKIYFFSIFVLCSITITAQEWTDNLPDKSGKQYTFYEIQNAFYDYWKPFDVQEGYYSINGQQVKASGYNQFKRWEWYWENRVDPITGEFPKETAADIRSEINKAKNSRDNLGNWSSMGPSQSESGYSGLGRINCIAFVPGVSNRFYVGSPSGGLWKTTNGGGSWIPTTDNNAVLGVSDAVVIPGENENSDIIYIATGDRDGIGTSLSYSLPGGQVSDNNSIGVLKSINGGATWTSTGLSWSASEKKIINRLLLHPTNNNILYAATSAGLYKITEGENQSLELLRTIEFIDIEFKPGDPMTMYGATKTGKVYVSTDGGSSWPKISLEIVGAGRVELAVSSDEDTWVYAVVTDNRLIGIHKSVTSGESFNLVFSGLYSGNNLLGYYCDGSGENGQAKYDLCLAVDPNDADILYLGGINTWKSYDGGYNWEIKNMWTSQGPANNCGSPVVHADKHCLTFQPGTNVLFEGNDGGVYKTTDAGSSWIDLSNGNNESNGLSISQIYRLGVSQTFPYNTLVGLQDNGTKQRYSSTWHDRIGGDGRECIIDYQNSNIQYGIEAGKIIRTLDGWTDTTSVWTDLTTPANFVAPLVMDPINHETLYYGRSEVWKTIDQGDNWMQISNIYFDKPIIALAVAPSNSNVIYAASKNYITKTNDGGENWEDITNTNVVFQSNITYISVKDNDPNTAWVSLGQYNSFGVYEIYETPGPVSEVIWTDISEGLPRVPVMCVIQNKQSLAQVQLFAGTDVGVYMKLGSSDWVKYSNSLPNVVVTELEIYYKNTDPSQSRLRAATYGRGLWETDMEFDNSSLIASPSELLEYYDVVVDEYRDKNITLTNNSGETITVSNIEFSGDDADQFAVTGPTNFEILPSNQQDVTVRFSPTESGVKEASIVISNSSQDLPVLTIPLHGIGVDSATRRLVTTPDSTYNYGDVTVNNSKTKTFYLLNTGSDTFTVTDLSVEGLNENNFTIVSQPGLPFDLENGESKQARIRFTPTSNGSKTANFIISCDADNGNPSYEIVLYGNGKNGIDHETITAYEYWFDDNYSNKVATQTNSGQNFNLNSNILVDSLSYGLHTFHIRFRDSKNQWSSTASEVFYKKVPLPPGERTIGKYEYWFDGDYETKISEITTNEPTFVLNEGLDAQSLPVGMHNFHIRFKDDAGQWSSTASEVFYKKNQLPLGERTIGSYEYWFDGDYGTKVSEIVANEQTFVLNEGLDAVSLPIGMHNFHIRFKDDAGQWSSTASEVFYKKRITGAPPNLITQYRYWYDMDEDNLNSVYLSEPISPYLLTNEMLACNLNLGDHTIHFQFKDSWDAWSSVVTDTFNLAAYQNIQLNAGWNIASFNVMPNQLRMDSIFKPLMDSNVLVKVIDESGGFIQYIPGLGWLNTIGNMSATEGYYTKVVSGTQLDLSGMINCTPYEIILNQGWNIMGYPLTYSQDGLIAVDQLITDNELVKVINETGGFIQYIPGLGWLNTIGNFVPGEGYYVKVSDNTSIILDLPATRSEAEVLQTPLVELSELTFDNNPYYPMNIIVTDISVEGFQVKKGDEIAVFDGERCVGAGVVMGYSTNTIACIVASQDDPLTEVTDGYLAGNEITFKYISQSKHIPIDLYPAFVWGDDVYEPLGTLICTLADHTSSLTENFSNKLFMNCYPNPTTGQLTIDYILVEEGDVRIELLDMFGNRVDKVEDGLRTLGTHQLKYNMANLSNGVYILRMHFTNNRGTGILIEKIVKQ